MDKFKLGDILFVNVGHLMGSTIDFGDMKYISREKYDRLGSGKFEKSNIRNSGHIQIINTTH